MRGRFPEATIFSLKELQKQGPLPGLAHLSIATSKHHGMRRAEVTSHGCESSLSIAAIGRHIL